MKYLDFPFEKLEFLERKGRKQADLITHIAKKSLNDLDLNDAFSNLKENPFQEIKNLNFKRKFQKPSSSFLKGLKILLAIILVAQAINLVWSFYLKKKRANKHDSRFDYFDAFSDEAEKNIDFDNASLEELEEALLKAEKQLEDKMKDF